MFNTLDLHECLQRGLQKLAFDAATEVQEKAVPLGLQGRDLMVSAQTGSGKTFAFLIPVLQRLLTTPDTRQGTRALILAPTRELAQQIRQDCLAIGSYTQLQFGLITGGEKIPVQRALITKKNPEIVIATPGRLLDLLRQDVINLAALEVLVLDEADRMLDMGFRDAVLEITGKCNPQRQTFLFSATLGHRGVRAVENELLNAPEKITLSTSRDASEAVRLQRILVDDHAHKVAVCAALLDRPEQEKAIIFCNKRETTEQLSADLQRADRRAIALHGELTQVQRREVLRKYRRGIVNTLVATDVAARGLDVEGITLVINFDVPRNARDFIHRIGRTGRGGEEGVAATLVSHAQWNDFAGIERYLGRRAEERVLEGLEAAFKGPKKLKASGKAVGKKNKKTRAAADKNRQRHRVKKNLGKRRKPAAGAVKAPQGPSASPDSPWKRSR
ncbi:DEAD/DEAH box helicase [Granulosicoccaceae sp. 1_MG-2023]|nr:DEAD/DEAH box helicase [Granulosicoccaceae sp. 1_MG-2023]